MNKYLLIRKIYLYLFSLIGLVLITIGAVRLVGLGLKAYIFTKADNIYSYPGPKVAPVETGAETRKDVYSQPSQAELDEYQKNQTSSQRQREAAESLAMIIIGLPLYLYHWNVIKKDKEETTHK